jgi:type I site-specific restriction endonuclease
VVDGSRIRREVIAPGRLQGRGQRTQADIADYVLIYRNTKLAVIEAKAWDKARTARINQRFLRRQASMHAVMRSAFPCVVSMLWIFCG